MRNLLILLACTALLASSFAWGENPTFRRSYIDGAHGQVHVLTSHPDTASRTPMICLQPNPMAGRYYRLFMEELGTDRVMLAPDYPGLGQSDPSAAMMDMTGYADSMAEVLDALGYGENGLGKVDVCGYHTGAMVAMELAVQRPDLVRRLVLAGIPFYQGGERERMYTENVVAKPLTDDFDSLRGTWEFTVSARQDGVSVERGYDNFVDILLQRDIMHWPYHAVFSYAAEEQAVKVTQPVLILNTHGGLENETRAIAPLFPNARLIEIPSLHHGVFDVGAELLAEYVRASEN